MEDISKFLSVEVDGLNYDSSYKEYNASECNCDFDSNELDDSEVNYGNGKGTREYDDSGYGYGNGDGYDYDDGSGDGSGYGVGHGSAYGNGSAIGKNDGDSSCSLSEFNRCN